MAKKGKEDSVNSWRFIAKAIRQNPIRTFGMVAGVAAAGLLPACGTIVNTGDITQTPTPASRYEVFKIQSLCTSQKEGGLIGMVVELPLTNITVDPNFPKHHQALAVDAERAEINSFSDFIRIRNPDIDIKQYMASQQPGYRLSLVVQGTVKHFPNNGLDPITGEPCFLDNFQPVNALKDPYGAHPLNLSTALSKTENPQSIHLQSGRIRRSLTPQPQLTHSKKLGPHEKYQLALNTHLASRRMS